MKSGSFVGHRIDVHMSPLEDKAKSSNSVVCIKIQPLVLIRELVITHELLLDRQEGNGYQLLYHPLEYCFPPS